MPRFITAVAVKMAVKMPAESNLWKALKAHLRDAHASRIESPTSPGIPDVYVMSHGRGAWLELKIRRGRRLKVRDSQVAWHLAHAAAGGRSYFLVRDEAGKNLWLYDGSGVLSLAENGKADPVVESAFPFDWDRILRAIFGVWPSSS